MKKQLVFAVVSALALSLFLTFANLSEAASKGKPGGGGGTQIEPAIVYVAIQGAGTKIMVANADGSNRIVVVDNGTRNSRPSWSPDGSRILFTSDVDGPGVYCVTINATGQPLHSPSKIVALSGDLYWRSKAVWSPTPVPVSGGTHKIAYANYNDASGFWSIYLRDITDCQAPLGTPIEVRNLSDTHYRHYLNPSWSPDSDRLAVLAEVDGYQAGHPYYDVQIVTLGLCDGNLCDTNWQSLINGTGGGSRLTDSTTNTFIPEWGRVDGTDFITLDANLDLQGERDLNVWLIPVNNPESATVLTTGTPDSEDYSPSWSPDNTEIIYSSRSNACKQVCQGTQIIVKRNFNGSGYAELIKEKYHVTQPKWWGPGQ